jgi:hypothetical protein
MCCAFLYVGAPLVGAGPAPRRDAFGRQLCEFCCERLNRVKHHRAYGSGRACHPRCIISKRSIKNGDSIQSTPVRSHRRAIVSSGKRKTTPLLIITPPSLPTLPSPSWHTHGWSLQLSSRSSRATSSSWLELARDSELHAWEQKRGGYYQHDTTQSLKCSFLDEKRVRLRHSAERIARAHLTTIGINATALNVAAMKLLRSSKGEGEQEVHYDIPVYDRAVKCFTVLIYLTATLSTAIPTQPLKELRHCFTDGEKRPSAAALKFLSRDKFKSERVSAGDMLVLNCAVPHYGVENPDEQDRYVLFLLFFPSASTPPDTEEQRYPHGVSD